MIRLNFLLVVAVLLSALYLVNVQYQSRRLFTELDRANAQSRSLAAEYERLKVERQSMATSARVERIAKDKLQMRVATPSITYYVNGRGANATLVGPAAQEPQ
jgi:cell division protein FtsL